MLEANGQIEVVDTQPKPEQGHPEGQVPRGMPPGFKVVSIGMHLETGAIQIEHGDKGSWEMTIAMLSVALEVAKFHRNIGHGNHLAMQAHKVMEEEQIKQALRQKGRLHV